MTEVEGQTDRHREKEQRLKERWRPKQTNKEE